MRAHAAALFSCFVFHLGLVYSRAQPSAGSLDRPLREPRKQQQQQSTLFQSFLFGMLPVERVDPQNLTGYVKGYVSF